MKKNGFTFIEVLGVITLLSILAVIVLISVNKSLKESIDTLSSIQIENIKSAAAMWRTDNIELIPDDGYYSISLSDLQGKGYIDNNIIDLKTEQAYSDDLLIEVGMNDVVVNDVLVKNGYKKLEYIEGTGTQYLATDYYLNEDSEIDMRFMVSRVAPNGYGIIFGARQDEYKKGYLFGDASGANAYMYGFYGEADNSSKIYKIIEKNPDYGRIYNLHARDGKFEISGLGEVDLASSDFTLSYPMYIFAFNEAGDARLFSKSRIYSFRVKENDTLIRNYIPCLRKSDKKPGFYETVTGKFYTNAGSGEFLYKLPNETLYTRLDYIESTGTQYINLGYKAKTNTELRLDLKFLENANTNVTNTVGNFTFIGQEKLTSNNLFVCNFGGGAVQKNEIYYWVNENYVPGVSDIYFKGYSSVLPRSILTLKSGLAVFQDETLTLETKTLDNTDNLLLLGNYSFVESDVIDPFSRYDVRVYGFQIYEGNELMRDLVPVKRNSDNAIGMYDLINGVFYGNDGTGEFVYKTSDENPYNRLYTKLDYIESTGTQYIDTGVYPNQDTSIEFTIKGSSNEFRFGELNSEGDENVFYVSQPSSGNGQVGFGNNYTSGTSDNKVLDLTNKHTYKLEDSVFSQDGQTKYTVNNTATTFSSDRSILLFALNRFSNQTNQLDIWYASGQLYGTKIWDNGTLIRNYVPVKRNRDNVIGLFDEVNDLFYTNAGTGTFSYGELN